MVQQSNFEIFFELFSGKKSRFLFLTPFSDMISWEWTVLEVGITSKPMGKTSSEVTLVEIFAVFQFFFIPDYAYTF